MKKKLTIGITTYNNQPFIYNLLYDINEQIKRNVKLLDFIDFVIYDDKSEQNDFLKFVPEYFTEIIAEHNNGSPAFGRNYIIDNAATEYIFFIDGDDVLVSSLTAILEELELQNQDILFSEVVKIGADGQHIKSPFIYTDTLFDINTEVEIKEKICVHQTGIWSIYRVDFLHQTGIRYIETMRYEDNFFLYSLLLKNPEVGRLNIKYYGWRVNFSSFSYSKNTIEHRASLYDSTMNLLKANLDNKFAPYILFSVWNQTFSNLIRNYPRMNISETKKSFDLYSNVSKKYNKEIKYLKKRADGQYVDMYYKYAGSTSIYSFAKIYGLKLINILRCGKRRYKRYFADLFRFLPIDVNKVFLTSQYGEYGSNPKYFYKELLERNEQKKITFFVKDKSLLMYKDFKDYNNKLLFYYHLYTAKEVYFDTWIDPTLKKRKNQKWIQMWHGYPYKKIYTDIPIYAQVNNDTKHKLKRHNISNWDEVYSLDTHNSIVFKSLFPSVSIVEEQYPRIKWLIKNQNNEALKAKIRKKYGFKSGCKYTLFAPTYRPYKVYFDSDEVKSLKKDTNTLIYHPHPMLNAEFDFEGKILANVEIQEILLIIDELITDYSSIKYDFLQINEKDKLITYEPDRTLYNTLHGLYNLN